tara:strand:+ start:286 stop:408 length:123 start_codon:yes stop_codon:yes gene_type:complete
MERSRFLLVATLMRCLSVEAAVEEVVPLTMAVALAVAVTY